MKKLLIGFSVIGLALVGCSATPDSPSETNTPAPRTTPAPRVAVPKTTATPKPKVTPKVTPSVTPFKSCKEAFEAGSIPIYPSNPRWNPKLDRDKDGMACEH